MPMVLQGYKKGKNGDLVLIGTVTAPHRKDMTLRERRDKRHLVRQGATVFKKEVIHPSKP